MKGRVNSFQSMGAVDGPGIRYTVFLQGCSLRCVYCHNPETWSMEGMEYDVEAVFDKIMRCRPYLGVNGGVTVSGGEPLLQWEFVASLFKRLREAGIHTALDTSGIGPINGSAEVLKYTDLVICDLKFSTEESYRKNCGGSLAEVLSFMDLTEQMGIPLWARHVVVPGLTDVKESLEQIVHWARSCSNLQKFEILPFKRLCVSKYEKLGITFPLNSCNECTNTDIEKWNLELGI